MFFFSLCVFFGRCHAIGKKDRSTQEEAKRVVKLFAFHSGGVEMQKTTPNTVRLSTPLLPRPRQNVEGISAGQTRVQDGHNILDRRGGGNSIRQNRDHLSIR
ncbi:hypothetical protein GE21DRAFT_1026551 [Neurospora crassa]|nr:hypothetical protein GE21DRAFT_1026551 [Neurospora crassa]